MENKYIYIRDVREQLCVTSLSDLHQKVATLLKIPHGCQYHLYRGSEPITEWYHVSRPIENGIPEIRCVIEVRFNTEAHLPSAMTQFQVENRRQCTQQIYLSTPTNEGDYPW